MNFSLRMLSKGPSPYQVKSEVKNEARNPRSLKDFPIHYESNASAWMTGGTQNKNLCHNRNIYVSQLFHVSFERAYVTEYYYGMFFHRYHICNRASFHGHFL